MAEALKNYQKIIKEESAKLKKLVGEIKYYQLTIRNYEMEIQRIDKELSSQTKQWFERERRGENVPMTRSKKADDDEGGEIQDGYTDGGDGDGGDGDGDGNDVRYSGTPDIPKHKLNSA